jgi:hypothetical protein
MKVTQNAEGKERVQLGGDTFFPYIQKFPRKETWRI